MRTSRQSIRWGKDKSGVWHVLPTMYIGALGMIDHQCSAFDTYLKVADDVQRDTTCPVCRGFLARTVVEDV